ncbi:hypothetical protein [Actinopolyspora xinjiangensis]|nr:hypothetical protein [Actinopolyspora xinjiangensis]
MNAIAVNNGEPVWLNTSAASATDRSVSDMTPSSRLANMTRN